MATTPTNMFGVPITTPKSSARRRRSVTSVLKKIILTLISIILFITGLFFFYVAWLSFQEQGIVAIIIPAMLGIILAGGGIIIGVSTIKKNITPLYGR